MKCWWHGNRMKMLSLHACIDVCSLLVLLLRFFSSSVYWCQLHITWKHYFLLLASLLHVLTSYTLLLICVLTFNCNLVSCSRRCHFRILWRDSLYSRRMGCFHVCSFTDSSCSSTSQRRSKLITWMHVVLTLSVHCHWKTIQVALFAGFIWYIAVLHFRDVIPKTELCIWV